MINKNLDTVAHYKQHIGWWMHCQIHAANTGAISHCTARWLTRGMIKSVTVFQQTHTDTLTDRQTDRQTDLKCDQIVDSVPANVDSIRWLTTQHVDVPLCATHVITCTIITQHKLVERVTFNADTLRLLFTQHHTTPHTAACTTLVHVTNTGIQPFYILSRQSMCSCRVVCCPLASQFAHTALETHHHTADGNSM